MKRSLKMISIAVLSLMVFTNGAWADPFEDFKTRVNTTLLKPFAKDLGGLIGGSDFSSGRTLSFPGFDVGLVTVLQFKPDSDNLLLKDAGVNAIALPTVQVSAAIPTIGVDAVVRVLSIACGITVSIGIAIHTTTPYGSRCIPIRVRIYVEILATNCPRSVSIGI